MDGRMDEEREGGSSNGLSPVVFHLRLHYAVTARAPLLPSEELTWARVVTDANSSTPRSPPPLPPIPRDGELKGGCERKGGNLEGRWGDELATPLRGITMDYPTKRRHELQLAAPA